MEREGRHHGYCFTVFEATEAQIKNLRETLACKYLCYGEEVCPETHKDHLQGYVNFAAAVTYRNVINKINVGCAKPCHVKHTRGTEEQNIAYCSKEDGGFFERGQRSKPGRPAVTAENPNGLNAKLLAVQQLVKGGKRMRELLLGDTFPIVARYMSGIGSMVDAVQFLTEKPKPVVYVCWGKTQTGKSHWVRECFGMDKDKTYWASLSKNKLWCGGYTGQLTFVMDDFEPGNMSMQMFKNMLDEYACMVEPKGSQVPFTSKYIIITANSNPKDWYRNPDISDPEEDLDYGAVQRRLGTVQHFESTYDHTRRGGCGFLVVCPIEDRVGIRPELLAPPESEEPEPVPSSDPPEIIDLTQEMDDEEEEEFEVHLNLPATQKQVKKRARCDIAIPSPSEIDEDDDEENEKYTRRSKPRLHKRSKYVLDECDEDEM